MYWFHFCLYMYEDNRFREDGAITAIPPDELNQMKSQRLLIFMMV